MDRLREVVFALTAEERQQLENSWAAQTYGLVLTPVESGADGAERQRETQRYRGYLPIRAFPYLEDWMDKLVSAGPD